MLRSALLSLGGGGGYYQLGGFSAVNSINTSVRSGTSISVILLEQLQKKGDKGEIVKVKRGFARNFLIPKKIAAYATEFNRERYANVVNNSKEVLEVPEEDVNQSLTSTLIRDGIVFRRDAANDSFSLFGSVSDVDIKAHLNSLGLSDYTLDMKGSSLKTIGVHKIDVSGNEIDVIIERSDALNPS